MPETLRKLWPASNPAALARIFCTSAFTGLAAFYALYWLSRFGAVAWWTLCSVYAITAITCIVAFRDFSATAGDIRETPAAKPVRRFLNRALSIVTLVYAAHLLTWIGMRVLTHHRSDFAMLWFAPYWVMMTLINMHKEVRPPGKPRESIYRSWKPVQSDHWGERNA